MPTVSEFSDSMVADLRRRSTGSVFLPADRGYTQECATYNLTTPLRPRLAVGASTVEDVEAAVRFATEHGLGVAVRGGGHAVAKQDRGIVVINMSRMSDVSLDAHERRVRVGGGALWQDVLQAATPAGLAPMSGSSPTVGVTGYLLGGGHSPYLGRSHGWAAEHITSLEMVTADGSRRTVTAATAPELFMAVRGTKGNFGVVTSVEMGLFPIGRIYAGGLWFAGEHCAAVLHGWREWVAEAPNEMSSSVAVQRLPDDPNLPGPLRGTFVVHIRVAYLGAADAGEKLLAPLRAVAPTVFETVRDLPYAEAATIHLDPPSPLPYVDRSTGLADLTADAVDALVGFAGPDSVCELACIEIRHLGGALDVTPQTADAIPARGLRYQMFAFGVGPQSEIPRLRGRLAELVERMRPWSDARRMVSFLSPDEAGDQETMREVYGAGLYDRLVELKREFDPSNTFRINHNIAP